MTGYFMKNELEYKINMGYYLSWKMLINCKFIYLRLLNYLLILLYFSIT